jgi:hypothetical protein
MSKQITIKLPALHEGQLKIVKELFNNNHFINIFCCSRGYGKTKLTEWLVLYYALKSKSKSLIVTPYLSQVRLIYNDVLEMVKGTQILQKSNSTNLEIVLVNGSLLKFVGSENFDGLRGFHPQYLYIDEFQFIKAGAWDVLRPMLVTNGKKCFIVSTPRQKQSEFYDLFIQGLSSDYYKSYHYTYRDNPLANLNEIEEARIKMPSKIFKAEYDGEFMDSGGEVFNNVDETCILEKKNITPTGRYLAGLDLGRVNDYTVLTIMNERKELVDYLRLNNMPWDSICNQVVNMVQKYKVSKCLVETNSIGDFALEVLQQKMPGVFEGQWTGSNKSHLIEQLAAAFDNNDIRCLNKNEYPALYEELNTFTYQYNSRSRTVKYEAKQGFHDDTIMSLAICLDCFEKLKYGRSPKIRSIKL